MPRLLAMIVLAVPALIAGCGDSSSKPKQPVRPASTENRLSDMERADGWELLFDGRTLTGWTTSGEEGAWAVVDGEIAAAKPGKGWWLRTTQMYRDFELKLDFRLPPDGNSGVGLRGSSVGDPAFTGFEIQILDSHGKAPSVTDCGAVYDAIAPDVQAVKPAGEWNTYHIKLVGDRLDAWLNGQQIHSGEAIDDRGYVHNPDSPSPLRDRLPTGFISLQDHGDAVSFRNVKIHDLTPSYDRDPGDFKPMTSGKDLEGWTARGGGAWTNEDGTITGRDGPGHLFSDETYDNFELRAFVRVNTRGNSGIYFRAAPRPEDPDTWPLGYEAQVDNHDPKNFTGCIYDRAWPEDQSGPITRDNAWLDYRIRAVNDKVETWINGVPMVATDLTDFSEGHIALQTHHNGNVIEFRDMRVRKIGAFGSGKKK